MCAGVSERVGGRVLGGEKAQKARPLRRERERRERERERRETYPLSHCVAQPNPNQATRGRDSSATSSSRAYLSWSCPPSVLRSGIPQQQAVSPGRGLVLGLGLGLSFLLLVFLRLLPVAHDLRHATTLVSGLDSRMLLRRGGKKGLKRRREEEFRRFRGERKGESKPSRGKHTKTKKRQKNLGRRQKQKSHAIVHQYTIIRHTPPTKSMWN